MRVLREDSIVGVEQVHFSGTEALLKLLRNHWACFPPQLGDPVHKHTGASIGVLREPRCIFALSEFVVVASILNKVPKAKQILQKGV